MFDKCPADILRCIAHWIQADDIARLWLCGNPRFNGNLAVVVEELRIVWDGPMLLYWPPLLSCFPNVHLVSLQHHPHLESIPFGPVYLDLLPKRLSTLIVQVPKIDRSTTIFQLARQNPNGKDYQSSDFQRVEVGGQRDQSDPGWFAHFQAGLPNLTSLSVYDMKRLSEKDILDLPRSLTHLTLVSRFGVMPNHWLAYLPPGLEELDVRLEMTYLRSDITIPDAPVVRLPPEPRFSTRSLKKYSLVDKTSRQLIESLPPDCEIYAFHDSPLVHEGVEGTADISLELLPKQARRLALSVQQLSYAQALMLPKSLTTLYISASSDMNLGDAASLLPNLTSMNLVAKLSSGHTLTISTLPERLTHLSIRLDTLIGFDWAQLKRLKRLKYAKLTFFGKHPNFAPNLPASLESLHMQTILAEELQVMDLPNLLSLDSDGGDFLSKEIVINLPPKLTSLSGLTFDAAFIHLLPRSLTRWVYTGFRSAKWAPQFQKQPLDFPPNLTHLYLGGLPGATSENLTSISSLPLTSLSIGATPLPLDPSIFQYLPRTLRTFEIDLGSHSLPSSYIRLLPRKLRILKIHSHPKILLNLDLLQQLPKGITEAPVATLEEGQLEILRTSHPLLAFKISPEI